MFAWYLHYSLLTAIVAVTILAWFKGGPVERLGSSINLVMSLAFSVMQAFIPPASLEVLTLVLDGIFGLIFLGLAVRYTSLWLGAAMLLQAGQFSLHAFYYVTTKPVDRLFAIVNNLVSWGILLSILLGTLGYWWVSRREAAKVRLS